MVVTGRDDKLTGSATGSAAGGQEHWNGTNQMECAGNEWDICDDSSARVSHYAVTALLTMYGCVWTSPLLICEL